MTVGTLLKEYIASTTEEYNTLLKSLFTDDYNDFLHIDNTSEDFFGKSHIYSTGNIVVRYIISNKKFQYNPNGKKMILIMGILSKGRKMIRQDVEDIKMWLEKIVNEIQHGTILIASVNNFSKPFIMNMVKRNRFKISDIGTVHTKSGNFQNIIVSI
jgi:hypothetical protein